jgi:hypothetical protein
MFDYCDLIFGGILGCLFTIITIDIQENLDVRYTNGT